MARPILVLALMSGICAPVLCKEDWIRRPEGKTSEEYKAWYWGLAERFLPRAFDPGPWAQAARDAGMGYVVFTTKHHDGFCLFDTHQTEFKITSGPFAYRPRANVTKNVFEAFRRQGQEFTLRQIGELMTDYGPIDILWLDGGWVRPKDTLTAEVLSWGAPIPDFDQSIDMTAIAAMARENQPGLPDPVRDR